MPFTFSHPAIIIPLKRWFSLTGLVIGSMSPDFEYFINMKITNIHGHSISGIFYYDLPLSIVIAFLFHNFIRDKLIYNLPKQINCRLNSAQNFSWNNYFFRNYLKVIVSIIIGVISHIFWDAFTHDSGYFVSHFEFLKENLQFKNNAIPVFKILQHSSTLIGAIIILYYFLNLPKYKSNSLPFNSKYWILIFGISSIFIFLRVSSSYFNIAIGNLIVTIIPSIFLGILFTSLLVKKNNYS